MARIIAKTRIKRDYSKFMYYIKEGAVWQVPRKVKGKKGKGGKKKLVQWGPKKMDYSKSIYFLDKNGNVASAPRKTRKKKAAKKTKTKRRSKR